MPPFLFSLHKILLIDFHSLFSINIFPAFLRLLSVFFMKNRYSLPAMILLKTSMRTSFFSGLLHIRILTYISLLYYDKCLFCSIAHSPLFLCRLLHYIA